MSGVRYLLCLLLLGGCVGRALALIIDHTALTQDPAASIPAEYIRRAKQMFRIGYQHTSHGSQIRSGMESLDDVFGADFAFTVKDAWGSATACDANTFYCDYWLNSPSDLGDGTNNFDAVTAAALNRTTNTRNVVMWSWCGGVSESGTDISRYLTRMDALEQQFPQVKFIYLTGHLDGSGVGGTLNVHNNEIREFCRAKNKILFDFADLESYDPDTKQSYLPLGCNDGCDYNQRARNWARDWHDAHAQHPLSKAADLVGTNCAHSEGLNCVQKAIAFWSLLARMAGWAGPGAPATSTTSSTSADHGTGPASPTGRSLSGLPSASRSSSGAAPAAPSTRLSSSSSGGRGTVPRSSSSTAVGVSTHGAPDTVNERPHVVGNSNLIIDHNCVATDVSEIPIEYIRKAKDVLKIGYQHTSHGSQLRSGMDALAKQFGADFAFTVDIRVPCQNAFFCDEWVGSPADLGTGRNGFDGATATALSAADNNRNVVMWSWCGGVSDSTTNVTMYLTAVNKLEQQFPNVTFIYMTGHLDGTGVAGTLHRHNEQIRAFCRQNNKVLFDFADIESYDPSGDRSFLPLNANDGCAYSQGNWATEWVQAHPQHTLTLAANRVTSCAHSEGLNCIQKSVAFWWLLARLAGWAGPSVSPPGTALGPDPASEGSSTASNSVNSDGEQGDALGHGSGVSDERGGGGRVAVIAGVVVSLLGVAAALSVFVLWRRRQQLQAKSKNATCSGAAQSTECSYTGLARVSATVPVSHTAVQMPSAEHVTVASPSAPRESSVSSPRASSVSTPRASTSAKRAPPPPPRPPQASTASLVRTQL